MNFSEYENKGLTGLCNLGNTCFFKFNYAMPFS